MCIRDRYRAVANACAKNPDPKNIPCHRVIKSDGSIGGYSLEGGIKKKKYLLLKEKNVQKFNIYICYTFYS